MGEKQGHTPGANGCSNPECACVPYDGGPLSTERMPWQLSVDSDGWPMVHNTGDVICVPDPNHHAGCAWDVERFRLIAAAPDLLAAVWALVEHFERVDGDASHKAVIKQATDAIGKATNRPSPTGEDSPANSHPQEPTT